MASSVKLLLAAAGLLLAGTGWSACSSAKEEVEPVAADETVVFGSFYGFCAGEKCIEIYQLNPTAKTLSEDTRDAYPVGTAPYEGTFVRRAAADYEAVQDLPALIPAELLAVENGVIGQPDAGDWGGYYLEVTHQGQRRFWLIDTQKQNLPAYLHPLADTLHERLQLLP